MECLRLRVKDIDFDQRQVIVREGKGLKDCSCSKPATTSAPYRSRSATPMYARP
jgi:integrase